MGFDWALLDSDDSCLALIRSAWRVLVRPDELCRALVDSGHSCRALVIFAGLLWFLSRSDGSCRVLLSSGYLCRALVL
jgi:hypothetical protein